ncbi:nuclear transport factor 2 family protein [Xenophilus arseniciresistens]|uniref:Nuclear transport factor 2 family protein n=1 Tax=Xenophilus arseniciresistens TaxID=1283306 RepID=A0AAE3NCM2_9BURK|nr:nuclear transport factor 2 family protein [Xenophilus arseniciresistens]MDA7417119.1 nuclear transport factor 2 family protein [Xenophilus arseniciresistens]
MEEKLVREFFERYQDFFRQGLKDEADMEQVASSYATAFIAASPAGVNVGQNDEQLKQVMRQGFERYRQIGTKDMALRGVRINPIDEHHCLAHVAWTATYDRGTAPDVCIDFDVHYLMQQLDDEPKIFGWVSGDEQALLRQQGIL